jgi:hypothetical protein
MHQLAHSIWIFTICLATTAGGCAAGAQTIAGSTSPELLGREIRSYAERFGTPGTPEYSLALRQAIAAAAAGLRDASEANDPNRTVDISKSPENLKTMLDVDRDLRYSKWLETKADHPLASLKIEGCESMEVRVIGGETLRNPRCFPQVSMMFSSPSK